MTRKCTVCRRRHKARGFCNIHYLRWRRHGTPRPDTPIDPRFGPGQFPVAPLLQQQTLLGLPNGRFANRIGVNIRTICRWRNNPNTRISFDRADTYALALNQDIDTLWTLED